MISKPQILTAIGLAVATGPAGASDDCFADAMIVFDGSGSMAEIGFDTGDITRISEARVALARAAPEITRQRRVGLIVYGPGPLGPCENVDLRFSPRIDAAEPIIQEVNSLRPGGLTPLTRSVEAAAEVLKYDTQAGTIVVVTDGNETCGGTPCATGAALAASARDLTIHVIGFRAVVDLFSWNNPEQADYGTEFPVTKCLADTTGGAFVTTQTIEELYLALNETLGCPVIGWAPQEPARFDAL